MHDSLAKHLYDSAVFFADKLVTLGGGSGVDVYTLAQVLANVIMMSVGWNMIWWHKSLALALTYRPLAEFARATTTHLGADFDQPVATQAFFMNGQFRRAFTLLKKSDLVEQDPRCCYLAARCLAELRDWEQCLAMLGGWDDEEVLSKLDSQVGCL